MPVTLEQRQAILDLLATGASREEVGTQIGVSPGQVSAVSAHATMGTYSKQSIGDIDAAGTERDIADAFDAKFGLERDMQLALRRSIEQLEAGLTVADNDREQTVPSGRIDITGRDRLGAVVVIELKAGPADRDAVGQILSYMGDLTNGGVPVRGILVAREFTQRAVAAARPVPSIRLVRYGFRFTFETVEPTISA